MTVFIDTNVIIDLLAKREPFYHESLKIFSLADYNQIKITVSSLSIVNTHSILYEVMKLKSARSVIGKFKVLVQAFELNEKIIDLALNDLKFKDFEDGIQYYTALESQSTTIVTRNLKDFKNSTIPVMSPKEFLANMEL